jgi:hypothetical protein
MSRRGPARRSSAGACNPRARGSIWRFQPRNSVTAVRFRLRPGSACGPSIYPIFAEANKYAAGVWKKAHTPEGLLRWIARLPGAYIEEFTYTTWKVIGENRGIVKE